MSTTPERDKRRRNWKGSRSQALVSQDRWLVSYADFITLLFALFVVLFASVRNSPEAFGKFAGAVEAGFKGEKPPLPEAGAEQLPAPDATAGALENELRTVLADPMAKHEVSLQQTPDGLVLSFREAGFFNSGEANILPGRAALILQAGDVLKRHGAVLRVEGHSDDQPIHTAVFASNWELSAARAMTVLLLLVNDAQYDPTHLSMAGYGPYRPIADNGTTEGRQQNRRVNLVVVSSFDK